MYYQQLSLNPAQQSSITPTQQPSLTHSRQPALTPYQQPLSQQHPDEEPPVYQSDDLFSDDYFINNWNDPSDEDSDYLTSHSWDVQTTPYCGSSSGTSTAISTGTGSGNATSTGTSSGNEGFMSPPRHVGGSGDSGTRSTPPPPFSTPPKLRPVEHVHE